MVRSAARLGISTLALLALAACAGAPTATAPPQAIAAPAVPISPDEDFLNRAATGTGNEIALGRLAQERGGTAAVRALGAHIAAEHSRAHAGLMALARQLNMVPNAVPADLSQFTALSGPDFDRQFLSDQVKNQQEALALFENEARAGQDPRLRRFARERVPMLRRDLQRAESVASRFGA